MEAWFRAELAKAKAGGAKQIIVFQHIPFFRKDANEPEVYDNMPVDVRQRYLKLMHENGVKWVFAGHQHHNVEARDGDLQVIATGPVGMPLRGAKSGIRVVAVTPDGVKHKYYDFGEIARDARSEVGAGANGQMARNVPVSRGDGRAAG